MSIAIHTLDACPSLQKPRRVKKYILVWCRSGHLEMEIDDERYLLSENTVVTITSGQVHHLVQSDRAEGMVIEFDYAFFCKDDNDLELIFQNGLFCHFAMNEVIPLGERTLVGEQLVTMQDELRQKPYQYMITVHSRLKLVLVEINRQKVASGAEIWKPDALFLKFLETIRAEFDKGPQVDHLAQLLKTTPAKLNELAKKHVGKTAQAVVHGLVASEGKRLLAYEKLSVKETAFALGFQDPFYFSKFFKKHNGVSPSEYLKSV